MKKANKKVNAAIIVIGNEILSGRTRDINVMNLSKWLNGIGVKVEELIIVPDNEIAIVHTINFMRKRFKYIFTTGGIGPTHDDITSQSIAKAFNLKYGYHKEAYAILEKYLATLNRCWMSANVPSRPYTSRCHCPGFVTVHKGCKPPPIKRISSPHV